jgi:hypothetical protein
VASGLDIVMVRVMKFVFILRLNEDFNPMLQTGKEEGLHGGDKIIEGKKGILNI